MQHCNYVEASGTTPTFRKGRFPRYFLDMRLDRTHKQSRRQLDTIRETNLCSNTASLNKLDITLFCCRGQTFYNAWKRTKGEGHRAILRPRFELVNSLYGRAAISVLFVLQNCGCLNCVTRVITSRLANLMWQLIGEAQTLLV
jgi:hypothetical protein